MFQRNDKVYAKLGGNRVAAIVLETFPSLGGQADQFLLKIAVQNPYFADRWIITNYPSLVGSTALTARDFPSRILGLDV